MPIRRTAAALVCGLLGGVGAACGGGPPASDGAEGDEQLPTMSISLGTGVPDVFPTATELVRSSYVVARGVFGAGPTVVRSSPEGEELATQLVVWEFVPDEVYRDVRVDDAPARLAEQRRGSILVAASGNQVGAMRRDAPVDEFVRSFPSVGNLNSFPVDRLLYVFLRPGTMPYDAVARDPQLAHVMVVTEYTHCYHVDDLDRSCSYVADVPGGEPRAVLEDGALVPRGLSPEAIAAAGSVAEVVGGAPGDPTIDTERYPVIPGGGGEG